MVTLPDRLSVGDAVGVKRADEVARALGAGDALSVGIGAAVMPEHAVTTTHTARDSARNGGIGKSYWEGFAR